LGFADNSGFLEAISSWFVTVTQFIGRFFTGETALISHASNFFSQVWSRLGRPVVCQETLLYALAVLLLSLVTILVFFSRPVIDDESILPTVKPTKDTPSRYAAETSPMPRVQQPSTMASLISMAPTSLPQQVYKAYYIRM
jgi:hypothetical protein